MNLNDARKAQERLKEIKAIQDEIYPVLLPKEIRSERDDLEYIVSYAVNKIAKLELGKRTSEMIAFLKEKR